jgi:hypothetical protein
VIILGLTFLLMGAGPSLPPAPGTVIASHEWAIGEHERLHVEVKKESLGESLAVRRGSTGPDLFKADDGNSFLFMYPTHAYGGSLITVWSVGSNFRIRVLRAAGEDVREVLDDGSDNPPELVFQQAEPLVLITTWEWRETAGKRVFVPARTTIYRWTGKEYAATGTAPWAQRFTKALGARAPVIREPAGGGASD